MICYCRLCSCLPSPNTGVPWGVKSRRGCHPGQRINHNQSTLSPPTCVNLTCFHYFLPEQAGRGTAICSERVDRLEPSTTSGAQGRASRKTPAKPLPQGEGREDRSRALAVLQLAVMLDHFVGVVGRLLPVVTSLCKLVRSCAS